MVRRAIGRPSESEKFESQRYNPGGGVAERNTCADSGMPLHIYLFPGLELHDVGV